eukprot:466205_1
MGEVDEERILGDEYDELTHTEEILNAICSLIVLFTLSIITIVHTYNMYSDFYTTERKVLQFRRTKSKITPGYKKMAFLTYISVFSMWILSVAQAIEFNFTRGDCKKMFAASVIDKLGYSIAKLTLYIILLYRLHEVYGTSAYGYSKRTLSCIGIFVVIYTILITILTQISVVLKPIYMDDQDDTYPWFCQTSFGEPWIIIVAGCVVLVDFITAIGSIIFFTMPLNKVIKGFNKYNDDKKKQDEAQTKR